MRFGKRENPNPNPYGGERRNSRQPSGNDYFYGGMHSQRIDWESREFDNNPGDRREGMYKRGGQDYMERARDTYGYGDEWYRQDQDWNDQRSTRARPGFIESIKSFFGVGPKGYKRSDERILEEVCEALARHPEVNASDIEVRVTDGHVTLSGTVENRLMKRQAEDAIAEVYGVEDVRVELSIPRKNSAGGISIQ